MTHSSDQPKKKFLLKDFLNLSKSHFFQTKRFSTTTGRDILPKEKFSYTYQTNNQTKRFLKLPEKNNSPNKNLLCLSKKLISHSCVKNLKRFISHVFLM